MTTIMCPHDNITQTLFFCESCGGSEHQCSSCGSVIHECGVDPTKIVAASTNEVSEDSELSAKAHYHLNIRKDYKVIEEFPEYMVSRQANVRHIPSGRSCWLERVTRDNLAMVTLKKGERKFTRSAQSLRDATWGSLYLNDHQDRSYPAGEAEPYANYS